jgi:hypothetical protein
LYCFGVSFVEVLATAASSGSVTPLFVLLRQFVKLPIAVTDARRYKRPDTKHLLSHHNKSPNPLDVIPVTDKWG